MRRLLIILLLLIPFIYTSCVSNNVAIRINGVDISTLTEPSPTTKKIIGWILLAGGCIGLYIILPICCYYTLIEEGKKQSNNVDFNDLYLLNSDTLLIQNFSF